MISEKMYLCPMCQGSAIESCESCNKDGMVDALVIVRNSNKLDEQQRPSYLLSIIAPDMMGKDTSYEVEEILSGIAPLLSDYVSVKDIMLLEIFVSEIREKSYFRKEEFRKEA